MERKVKLLETDLENTEDRLDELSSTKKEQETELDELRRYYYYYLLYMYVTTEITN